MLLDYQSDQHESAWSVTSKAKQYGTYSLPATDPQHAFSLNISALIPPREGRLECQLMPGPRWLPDLLQHGQVLCKLAFQGSFSCKQGCRQTVYSVKTVTSAFARCSLPGGFAVHGQSVKQTQHRASPLESSIRRHSTPPRIGSHNKVSTAPGTADLHC